MSRVLDSPTYNTGPSSHPDFYKTQTSLNKSTATTPRTNATPCTTPDAQLRQLESIPASVQDMNPINATEITAALKEWAIVCKALEEGRQVVLLRKGGIREYRQGFEVKHNTFLLYPTFEHQSRDYIQPDYTEKFEMVIHEQPSDKKNKITSYARAVGVKQITGGSLLPDLQKYHIWKDSYVNVRMNYNPKKPMSIVLLRVYKLDDPIEVDVKSEWDGCKSWIPIESFPFQLQSTNQIQEQYQLFPECQPNHDKYYSNIRYNGYPVLENSKFDKVVAEIEEILK